MNVTDEIYHWDQIAPVNRWKRWINQLDPVYNLQSTDDNKEYTDATYRCQNLWRWNRSTSQDATNLKDITRCSSPQMKEEYEMLQPGSTKAKRWDATAMKDEKNEKPATDQQMINGSTK